MYKVAQRPLEFIGFGNDVGYSTAGLFDPDLQRLDGFFVRIEPKEPIADTRAFVEAGLAQVLAFLASTVAGGIYAGMARRIPTTGLTPKDTGHIDNDSPPDTHEAAEAFRIMHPGPMTTATRAAESWLRPWHHPDH